MTGNTTPNADDVVILAGARTPQGKMLGQLADLTSVDLGAHAVRAAVERAGIKPEDVGRVVLGQVILAGAGQNPARQTAIKAGLPWTVPAEIVAKVCLSGLDAVIHAARMIRLGEVDVVVAGGQESMTNAPHIARGVRKGKSYGALKLEDALELDGLVDSYDCVSMGTLTDGPNADLGISRADQDEVAALSHQRAAKAQADGILAEEIAPIEIPQRKGDPIVVDADQGIRPDTTVESLSLELDGLVDSYDCVSMGTLTDGPNADLGISRADQDEVAALSHQRAAKAQADGILAEEIAPIEIPQRKGDPIVVDADQGIRPDTTVESLSKLRAVFMKEGGTITAGNSSPISDGAAALVLARRGWAEERGLDYLAVVGKAGQTAGPDNSLHAQPSDSLAEALRLAGWEASDLDFIEINEAFGAVAVKSLRDLDYPLEKCNIHGGAIALGHPIGCSGARLALTAAMELARRGSGKAGVSLCGGGGQGDALLLYRD